MSPTPIEVNEWFGFDDQRMVLDAFSTLFLVKPELRDEFIWVVQAVEKLDGELVLRHKRSYPIATVLEALDTLYNRGEYPGTTKVGAKRFFYDVNEGNVVIKEVLFQNMNKKRRKSPAEGY